MAAASWNLDSRVAAMRETKTWQTKTLIQAAPQIISRHGSEFMMELFASTCPSKENIV